MKVGSLLPIRRDTLQKSLETSGWQQSGLLLRVSFPCSSPSSWSKGPGVGVRSQAHRPRHRVWILIYHVLGHHKVRMAGSGFERRLRLVHRTPGVGVKSRCTPGNGGDILKLEQGNDCTALCWPPLDHLHQNG